jgi:hypothetical protein
LQIPRQKEQRSATAGTELARFGLKSGLPHKATLFVSWAAGQSADNRIFLGHLERKNATHGTSELWPGQ